MIASLQYMPAVFLNQWPNASLNTPEPEPPELPGPKTKQFSDDASEKNKNKSSSKATVKTEPKAKTLKNVSAEMKVQSDVRKLINWENNVKQHEQAHMAVGGGLVSTARFSYTLGPDGKRYVSGGEVSISIPSSENEEDNLNTLERVKRAALAPADPSPQDIKTAAMASALLSSTYLKLLKQKAKEESSGKKSNIASMAIEPTEDAVAS